MTWPGVKRRTCTLCGSNFLLMGPDMTHPADLLCNACIAELWGTTEPDDELEARFTRQISRDQGLDPAMIAAGIVHRIRQLRQVARSESELQLILHEREPK